MNSDYHEIDHCAMAHEQQKWFEEREANSWRAKYERFCEENPWDPECKIFDL